MTSEQLAHLQDGAYLFLLFCFAAGVIHLVLGLMRPGLVWRRGRGGVVGYTLGIWLLGVLAWAGTIGFTHSHPNGPHALKGYLDDYFAEECAKGADLPACKKDGGTPAAAPTAAP